jgi:hypothetical protein
LVEHDVIALLEGRRGHFLLESGHHGDLWLELDRLFARPARVEPFAAELARRLSGYEVEVVRAVRRRRLPGGAGRPGARREVRLGRALAGRATHREGVPLERLAALPNTLWEPADCPLCATGTPLD